MPSIGNYKPEKYYPQLSTSGLKKMGRKVKAEIEKIYSSKPRTYRRKK